MSKYESIELLHIVTIVHSISCFILSGFVYLILQGRTYIIDRRLYISILLLGAAITIAYFASLVYVVLKTQYASVSQNYAFITLIENILDLISSLSNNILAFIFAIIMNFLIFFSIYGLNWCSLYMSEVAKQIEWNRTGGRGLREVELNRF